MWTRETVSSFDQDEKIFGREKIVLEIITTLINCNSQETISVMAIVGMAGLGKTTLAKSVYNDVAIEKSFDKKIWVCVLNTFDTNLI